MDNKDFFKLLLELEDETIIKGACPKKGKTVKLKFSTLTDKDSKQNNFIGQNVSVVLIQKNQYKRPVSFYSDSSFEESKNTIFDGFFFQVLRPNFCRISYINSEFDLQIQSCGNYEGRKWCFYRRQITLSKGAKKKPYVLEIVCDKISTYYIFLESFPSEDITFQKSFKEQ